MQAVLAATGAFGSPLPALPDRRRCQRPSEHLQNRHLQNRRKTCGWANPEIRISGSLEMTIMDLKTKR